LSEESVRYGQIICWKAALSVFCSFLRISRNRALATKACGSATKDVISSHQGFPDAKIGVKGGKTMSKKSAVAQAKEDRRAGKSPKTATGEFVREEIEHLGKGRRAGIPVLPPEEGHPKGSTRKSAER
jgi:hypothetical protein